MSQVSQRSGGATPTRSDAPPQRFSTLDGLRGIAALAVLPEAAQLAFNGRDRNDPRVIKLFAVDSIRCCSVESPLEALRLGADAVGGRTPTEL